MYRSIRFLVAVAVAMLTRVLTALIGLLRTRARVSAPNIIRVDVGSA